MISSAGIDLFELAAGFVGVILMPLLWRIFGRIDKLEDRVDKLSVDVATKVESAELTEKISRRIK